MSDATPTPVVVPRRPAGVALAAVLLTVMALVGLGYAIASLVVTPGVVSRFRAGAGTLDPAGADGYVTALWVGAGIATVLGVIVFALYAALAVGLRRGSRAALIGTWAVCGLGLAAGCGSAVVVAVQRSGWDSSDELLTVLDGAYPTGWIGLNLSLSVLQMVGYLLVAALLVASPRAYFRPAGRPGVLQPTVAQPHLDRPGFAAPPSPPPPAPGPDDEYWARPS